MAVLQKRVALEEADQMVLSGWELTEFGKSVARLVNEQVREAAKARDMLIKAATVGPNEVAAARRALEVVRFWAAAVPQGFLHTEVDSVSGQGEHVAHLLAQLESLLGAVD